jgi:hypothetical protein
VEVCDLSGLLPTPACGYTHKEWFIAGTEPTETDQYVQQIWVDTSTNSLANNATPVERRSSVIAFNFPVEAQAWAHAQGLPLLSDYSQAESPLSQPANPLILLSPSSNTTYRIDPNFDLSSQQLQIEVAVGAGISHVTLWMDGNLLTAFPSEPYQTWWTLSAGEHQIWAQGLTANGDSVRSAEVTIAVISN